jgi:3-oxoacyl-[acyl-carrier protein] reductase
VPFDVTDFDETQKQVKFAQDALGGIDIVCSNAGIAPTVDFVDMTPEAWDRMMKVHLYGAFNVCKSALPFMLSQNWGRIIVTASMSAVNGDVHLTHYSAAKAGQVGLVRSLAREVVARGVTVNAIAPGLVKTNILGEVDDEVLQKYEPPVGRIGLPLDQAYAALYLASNEAEFMTGQLLQVNGGSY